MALPSRRTCGVQEVHARLLEQYPEYRARNLDNESRIRTFIREGRFTQRAGITTIPVVVHVVYQTDEQNVSDSQIASQLTVLNQDHRRKNADLPKLPGIWSSLAADARVEFRLADTDPLGIRGPGIIRVQTDKSVFGTDEAVKSSSTGGSDPWATDRYLNLWVCNLGTRLLGYAQFPAGPPDTDGVVIHYQAFGTEGTASAPFNLGRTATHEVGHWLSLRHIWGDRDDCSTDDEVEDTPVQATPNYGKPSFPHISCNNGPSGDMFMNYMDYVDDDSMFFFTEGQAARIAATLDGPRATIGQAAVATKTATAGSRA